MSLNKPNSLIRILSSPGQISLFLPAPLLNPMTFEIKKNKNHEAPSSLKVSFQNNSRFSYPTPFALKCSLQAFYQWLQPMMGILAFAPESSEMDQKRIAVK